MTTEIGTPTWEMLRQLIDGCAAKLLICSPWISTTGVEKLETFLASNARVRSLEIWTRLTEVATDSRSLLKLVRTLCNRGVDVTMKDSECLHLKVYLGDRTAALLGSANLTNSGFSKNPEIIVSTSEPMLLQQIISVLKDIQMDVVSYVELEEFVSTQLPGLEREVANNAKPKVSPVWRRKRYPAPPQSVSAGKGRRAFLLGSDPSSGNVQQIVKMALWGQRSINIYNLLNGKREKIYPASEALVLDYRGRCFEIDEPYLPENLAAKWVKFGRDAAAKLGFKVAL
jgi:PLD-like domain